MNFDIFVGAAIAIQIHIIVAFIAVIAGALQLVLKKGTTHHRVIGWFWVLLMTAVSVSSFLIHELRVWGAWSPIHLLSVFTLCILGVGIWAARNGRVKTHAITMAATYVFALILTGALTLLPGRMMHHMLLG
ncbi:DUF2306 domain-containing protein [Marinobacter halotolerans]|uniref:DUF2306 domain-containing protein n=1 Tax=Marinobacter halotolerans TaxID=1569211 RepID=UPI001246F2C4|nr:DUF2306 domain-containing protein [Marinobacter halotolerans]